MKKVYECPEHEDPILLSILTGKTMKHRRDMRKISRLPRLADLVQINKDYANGWINNKGVITPIKSNYAGQMGIIIYIDDDDCTLFFQDCGEVSWFPLDELKILKRNQHSLLVKWKNYLNKKRKS